MGKFKPFLFGALFGAGTVFVGLQYHIVQSHEGVRVVPRTPQHAIGLAYVDIRNWGSEQWADRPELARALVAHGSTDLVASSVTEGLAESISSESAILDGLRGFVNESSDTGNADSLFNDSDFEPISGPSDSQGQDLMTIPFEDARRKPGRDAASTINSAKRPSLASRDIHSNAHESASKQEYRSADDSVATSPSPTGRRNIPSVDDVFESGRKAYSRQSTYGTENSAVATEYGSARGGSAQQETDQLEKMLFGNEDSSFSTSVMEEADTADNGFEDITSVLENRAAQALKRARAGSGQPSSRSSLRSADSATRYVRDSAQDSSSAPASSMSSVDSSKREYGSANTGTQIPDPLQAIRDGFDPFVE
ncbi:MAG: hypothetical protein GY826_13680 [Fuerstiella sp.]|nr:hypothetical protein [Fuerstiella sp.]